MPTTPTPDDVTAFRNAPGRWPRRVAALRFAWLAYAGLLAIGLVVYFAHDGSSTTPRFAPAPPPADAAAPRDLARLDAGAVLTASSYDLGQNSHPLFLIDGDDDARGPLRWASAARDRAPWLVLELVAPANLERLELTLAHPLPAAIAVSCLRAAEVTTTRDVPRITARLRVPLDCADADAVRVDFTPNAAPDSVSVVRASELLLIGVPTPGGAP